jgi:hypothetical protein
LELRPQNERLVAEAMSELKKQDRLNKFRKAIKTLLLSPGDESPFWFWVFIASIFLGMIFFLTWLAPEVKTPGFMKAVLHSVWIEPLAP